MHVVENAVEIKTEADSNDITVCPLGQLLVGLCLVLVNIFINPMSSFIVKAIITS